MEFLQPLNHFKGGKVGFEINTVAQGGHKGFSLSQKC